MEMERGEAVRGVEDEEYWIGEGGGRGEKSRRKGWRGETDRAGEGGGRA